MKGEFPKLTLMALTVGDDFQMALQNCLAPELNMQCM